MIVEESTYTRDTIDPKSLHPMSKRRRLSVNRAVSYYHRYTLVKLNLRPAIV
jgi:hypothetical protein